MAAGKKTFKRKIIRIDEARCNGCGQCVTACVEGALKLVNGKARLARDSYCDGLGACLGECPQDAIIMEEREAEAFDEAAAKSHAAPAPLPCGCPGTAARALRRPDAAPVGAGGASQLGQWPIQLALLSPDAPFFSGRELALVADCVGFACPDLHARILAGRAVAVACPKLDDATGRGYVEKLAAILKNNAVPRLTVYRMEVPCCAGLARLGRQALELSGAPARFEEIIIPIQST